MRESTALPQRLDKLRERVEELEKVVEKLIELNDITQEFMKEMSSD